MTRVCLHQIDCVFRSQNLNPKSSSVMLPNEICNRFGVGLGASTIRVHFVFKASLDRKNKISTAHPVSIHPSVCLFTSLISFSLSLTFRFFLPSDIPPHCPSCFLWCYHRRAVCA